MFDIENIKAYYRLGRLKIKYFLQSQKCKEYLVFLFFVVVSFIFWGLQTLDEVYQAEFDIPIRLKNVPKELVLTAEPPKEVQVRVEDRGTVLLNYMLGRTFYPVSFDFEDYEAKGNHIRILPEEFRKRLMGQLNVSTRVISFSPDTLEYIYTRGKAKKLPVKFRGEVSPGRQYYISKIDFLPDSVMVYAPQEVLDTLKFVYSSLLQAEGITDTLRRKLALAPIHGVKAAPSSCEVMVCVDMFSEKTVEVPVVGVGFPEGKVLRTFPTRVQVAFQVGLKNFKQITSQDFRIEVSYQDILENKGDKLPLHLKVKPETAEHVRILPAAVDYLIEQQN